MSSKKVPIWICTGNYILAKASPTMHKVEDRPALTDEVRDFLYPYLRAWTDEVEMGDTQFDACASVEELCGLLAYRLLRLPGLEKSCP